MTRLVTYGAATSLDGFIAGPDHETDWLTWNEEVAELTGAYWATVDTVVMGRLTWEAAVRAGTMAYPNVTNYLCSKTAVTPPDPRITLASDAVALIRRLREQPGRDICVMGGGQLARSLINAGLIDRIGVNIQPVMLGGGIPLLPAPGKRLALRLIDSRMLTGGTVYLLYQCLESPLA